MHRALDTAIVAKAKEEDSIVLTCDLDFGDIMAASGERYPSVILFRLEDETPSNINRRLSQVLKESSSALEEGAVVIVETTRHRVRFLPI
jgi:predicted nuclease of predicted toxin-antitoxin system